MAGHQPGIGEGYISTAVCIYAARLFVPGITLQQLFLFFVFYNFYSLECPDEDFVGHQINIWEWFDVPLYHGRRLKKLLV
jgi:hypothetical protein